jgi:hypothetical protein
VVKNTDNTGKYRQTFAGVGIWSPEYRYSGIGVYRIGNTSHACNTAGGGNFRIAIIIRRKTLLPLLLLQITPDPSSLSYYFVEYTFKQD